MAIPNEIQTGRFNSILHKLLDMKEGAPAPTLAPDIFAMMALEVDRPEWKFLAGERLSSGSRSIAAGGAGTYGNLVLWNPSGSGVIAILSQVHNLTNAERVFSVAATATDVSGTYTAVSYRGLRDSRWGVLANAKPTCLLYSLATASPTSTNVLTQIRLSAARTFESDWVIAPGTGLSFIDLVANESFNLSLTWRERGYLPSESR